MAAAASPHGVADLTRRGWWEPEVTGGVRRGRSVTVAGGRGRIVIRTIAVADTAARSIVISSCAVRHRARRLALGRLRLRCALDRWWRPRRLGARAGSTSLIEIRERRRRPRERRGLELGVLPATAAAVSRWPRVLGRRGRATDLGARALGEDRPRRCIQASICSGRRPRASTRSRIAALCSRRLEREHAPVVAREPASTSWPRGRWLCARPRPCCAAARSTRAAPPREADAVGELARASDLLVVGAGAARRAARPPSGTRRCSDAACFAASCRRGLVGAQVPALRGRRRRRASPCDIGRAPTRHRELARRLERVLKVPRRRDT